MLDVYWDLLSVQLIVYPIIGGWWRPGYQEVWRLAFVQTILKDIQNLKCEDKSLVLNTEDSATKSEELIVEFLTGITDCKV